MNVTAKTSIWGKIMKGGVKSIITCIHGLCWMSGILPLFAPVLFETLWNPIFNLFDCQVPHGHPVLKWRFFVFIYRWIFGSIVFVL